MKLTVKVIQAGQKHPLLENKEIDIGEIGNAPLLKDFLKAVVRQQVEEFNSKIDKENLLEFLISNDINESYSTGKVGFGRVSNDKKADLNKAEETALLAFEDGLFSVFVEDKEIVNLDDELNLNEKTEITFIRLTFLAGSYW